MSYTDELRKHVADLFGKATDAETVKQYAKVEQEINSIETKMQEQDQKEVGLLKDLKEAYLHTAAKPTAATADQVDKDIGGKVDFNANATLSDIIASVMQKRGN